MQKHEGLKNTNIDHMKNLIIRNLFLTSIIWITWRGSDAPTVQVRLYCQLIIRICTADTSIVGKSSKNNKASNMWFHYCYINNHKTADFRAISMFKHQKKVYFEAKAGSGKKFLDLFFEEINAIKRQLKPEKTASSKKIKAESLFSTGKQVNLTISNDEGDNKESLILLNQLVIEKINYQNHLTQPLSL
jgi:hypothetical protein